jgi:Prenyltransferase and squalene oxidase repeat
MLQAVVSWLLLAAGMVPTPANVRAAADRAMPLLYKAAEGHIAKQTCFACHNQALPMLAFHAARDRGFPARDEEVEDQVEFVADFLKKNKDKVLKGVGTGGQVDTAGYAMLTLELGGYKPDDVTAAVVEYMLKYQSDRDHWRAVSNRPPSEASDFTTTYLGLRALRVWGTPAQLEAIEHRMATVRGWLLRARPKDTEDRVFRLLALKEVGADADLVRGAADALARTQRPDGSFSQLDGQPGDAYATGSALVALHRAAGLAPTDSAYVRGIAFLLRTQAADGTWYLKSRSKPFQPYYEGGFPYGKDQFISSTASGWAATALLIASPNGDAVGAR